MNPKNLRQKIREGSFTKPTSGCCPGYLQANMVILHKDLAPDFKRFCEFNSQACPLICMLNPGEKEPISIAPGSDVTTDLPKYHIYHTDEHGQNKEERTDIKSLWNNDLVTFLLGCSFSFEKHLMDNGVPVRNIEQGKNVSMFITNRDCVSVGPFNTKLVVSYRPIPKHLVDTVYRVTKECGVAHGPPVHVGDESEIGIKDISKPDFGDPVDKVEGDVGVFWACGVTSTTGAISSKSPLIITHAPGHMFVSDIFDLGGFQH
jgi:uncharacterized protein YcsI (UPF0317 family)